MADEPTLFERPYYVHVAAWFLWEAQQPESEPTYTQLKARLYPKRKPVKVPRHIQKAARKAREYRSSHEPDGGGLALGLAMGIGLGSIFHG